MQGARLEEIFVASLQKLEPQIYFIPEIQAEQIETDSAIVGEGPAGLTAGIYSAGNVEGRFKQIVTAAGQGVEAVLSIFEDLVSPYWKAEEWAALFDHISSWKGQGDETDSSRSGQGVCV